MTVDGDPRNRQGPVAICEYEPSAHAIAALLNTHPFRPLTEAQMCEHAPNREAAMVVVQDGVWCDPCLSLASAPPWSSTWPRGTVRTWRWTRAGTAGCLAAMSPCLVLATSSARRRAVATA